MEKYLLDLVKFDDYMNMMSINNSGIGHGLGGRRTFDFGFRNGAQLVSVPLYNGPDVVNADQLERVIFDEYKLSEALRNHNGKLRVSIAMECSPEEFKRMNAKLIGKG